MAGTSLHAKKPKCHHPPYSIVSIVVGTQNTPTKIPENAKLTVYIFRGFRLLARAVRNKDTLIYQLLLIREYNM